MAESPLEQKVNAQEKKEEKVSVWKSGINEIIDGTRTATNLGIAAGLPIGTDILMGGVDASSTAAAFYLGARDKSSRSARLESIIGTAFAGFAKLTLGAISTLGAYSRAALIPPWQAAANAFYLTTDHIVKNKSLSGLGKKFKEKYMDITKKAILYLSIPTYLTTFLPGPLQIPSIALQSYIFRKFIAPDKKEPEKPKDKTPYLVAFGNVMGRTTKGLYEAVYTIGSTLKEKLYKATVPQAPIQATAPAK